MECLKEDAKMILAVEMLTNPVVKVIEDEFILSSSTEDLPLDLVIHSSNLVLSKGNFAGFVANLHQALPDLKEYYLDSKAVGKKGKKAQE